MWITSSANKSSFISFFYIFIPFFFSFLSCIRVLLSSKTYNGCPSYSDQSQPLCNAPEALHWPPYTSDLVSWCPYRMDAWMPFARGTKGLIGSETFWGQFASQPFQDQLYLHKPRVGASLNFTTEAPHLPHSSPSSTSHLICVCLQSSYPRYLHGLPPPFF